MRVPALAVLLGLLVTVSADAQTPRTRTSLNAGWRFHKGDEATALSIRFNDRGWEAVSLPHTWNAADARVKDAPYYRGIGWYRRSLQLPVTLSGRRIFLWFEGANQVADVWVNGKVAGRHVGGYTAFALDVTKLVVFGRPNVVAVRVSNAPDPEIPPLSADFTFYGGLYRDVWLVATDPVHLAVTDHAAPGIFVDARELETGEHAIARVRGTVVNDGRTPRRIRVLTRIVDAAGREAATLTTTVPVAAGASVAFEQASVPIPQPHLWSPDDPYLYAVSTELREGQRLLDRVEVPFGFRWYGYDAQKGFSLNGKSLQLHGANRHQDVRGLGNAVPDSLHRRDLRLIKQTGFDFLRLAHYPQDPAVLDEADRIGLILWEEIPVVNTITQSEAFAANAEAMLVDMIRQHYDHPSVFFWGYMNEVLLVPPKPTPANYVSDVVALAQRLNTRAHAEDSTRATVMAVIPHDPSPELDRVSDILGLNLYFGWYYGALPDFGAYVDSVHAAEPRRPLMISEYGAGGDRRIHALAPQAFDFSSEYERRFHEGTFPQILARPWLLGSALWNQFDFGSWNRDDAQPTMNDKGLYTFGRRPKDVAFYYQARLRSDPVVHLATRDWSRRAGSDPVDREQPVVVYGNGEALELFLDGRSLGAIVPANGRAEWTVTMHPGENRLEARTTRGGQSAVDSAVVRYEDRAPLFGTEPGAADGIAVDAGARVQYVDSAGVIWEADREYQPGSWGFVGGSPVGTHHRILDTRDDPLLQTTREGAALYHFDVPAGRYHVELRFVEMAHDAPGQRVFSVGVNGTTVADALDLATSPGRWHARTLTADVDATGKNGITVELGEKTGKTTISAIRVTRL